MILKDICLLAADTSRSKAYLTSLVKNKLIPSLILLLPQNDTKNLPGDSLEENNQQIPSMHEEWSESLFDTNMNIKKFLNLHNLNYEEMTSHDINIAENVELINYLKQNIIIYSGYGGVLLKQNLLSTGKRFLHVHGGFLPNYKGSTTNFYSLLQEGFMGASSIFLNERIDSGPIILRKKFPIPNDLTKIDHIFDAAARSKVLIETLRIYSKNMKIEEKNYTENSEIYYIIHPLLKHIAILRKK